MTPGQEITKGCSCVELHTNAEIDDLAARIDAAIKKAEEVERENCARIADDAETRLRKSIVLLMRDYAFIAEDIASDIRARGTQ